MRSQASLSSKQLGDTSETAVIETVGEVEYLPDTDDVHADAVVTDVIIPSVDLPSIGTAIVGVGTLIEIKSAAVVYGDEQRRGRFHVREGQHNHLKAVGGYYLFAVVDPNDREPVALKIVPPSIVDDYICDWISTTDDRPPYSKFSWGSVFEKGELVDDRRGGRE